MPPLPAADDHHIRLLADSQRVEFVVAFFEPGLAARVHAVLGALDAVGALALLEALQLGHRGEQRPGLALLQAQVAAAAGHRGLEGEPGVDAAAGLRRLAFNGNRRGLHVGQPGLQHRADRVRAFLSADVPGEGDQVAPVAVGAEQDHRGDDVLPFERGLEVSKPSAGGLGRVGGQVGLRECLLRSGAAPVCGCGLPTIIHPAGLPRHSRNPQTATAKPMRPAMLAPTPHARGVLMLIAVGSYPLHRSLTHTSATAYAPSRRLRRSSRRTPA